MIGRTEFEAMAQACFEQLRSNSAILPAEGVRVPVLEAPIVGFATADDPLFEGYRAPAAIGPEFMTPREWMPGAQTVAALFFPFSEDVRRRHRGARGEVSEAWNAAYGQHFQVVDEFLDALIEKVAGAGVSAIVPTRDGRFAQVPSPVDADGTEDLHFSVSWSHRHAAFATGLGTFGIHRHLITEKGCCGGLATLLLDSRIDPTRRAYEGLYDHCTKCGACTRRCPVGAISVERLRNIKQCSEHGADLFQKYNGACGKCLVGIPCEARNPMSRVKSQNQ